MGKSAVITLQGKYSDVVSFLYPEEAAKTFLHKDPLSTVEEASYSDWQALIGKDTVRALILAPSPEELRVFQGLWQKIPEDGDSYCQGNIDGRSLTRVEFFKPGILGHTLEHSQFDVLEMAPNMDCKDNYWDAGFGYIQTVPATTNEAASSEVVLEEVSDAAPSSEEVSDSVPSTEEVPSSIAIHCRKGSPMAYFIVIISQANLAVSERDVTLIMHQSVSSVNPCEPEWLDKLQAHKLTYHYYPDATQLPIDELVGNLDIELFLKKICFNKGYFSEACLALFATSALGSIPFLEKINSTNFQYCDFKKMFSMLDDVLAKEQGNISQYMMTYQKAIKSLDEHWAFKLLLSDMRGYLEQNKAIYAPHDTLFIKYCDECLKLLDKDNALEDRIKHLLWLSSNFYYLSYLLEWCETERKPSKMQVFLSGIIRSFKAALPWVLERGEQEPFSKIVQKPLEDKTPRYPMPSGCYFR